MIKSSFFHIILAVVVVAFTPPLAGMLLPWSLLQIFLIGPLTGEKTNILSAPFYCFCAAVIISLLHVIILGMPCFFALRHFNKLTRNTSLICGFLIGALPLTGFEFYDLTTNHMPFIILCIFGAAGMYSGYVAWLFWLDIKAKFASNSMDAT